MLTRSLFHPADMRSLQLVLLTALLVPAARSQGLFPAYVTDTAGDTIWALTDTNADGDYDDAGEVAPFYDDTIGPIGLTNNAGLIRTNDGALWVSDTSEDFVLRLVDMDGDGTAHGATEATVWFDGTAGNTSGVELTSGRGMWSDPDGTIWVASANTGGGGNDAIVRLKDVNTDGDANDAGESLEYFVIAPGGAVGDSIPTAVARGADGALYYTETGSTGFLAKGVYRLEDVNGSGVIDAPNEVTPFFLPPALPVNAFHWDLAVDASGRFLMNDTGNDVIWRFSDVDGDGVVDPVTEAVQLYMAPSTSLIWEVTPASDGSLYVAEDQTPDRLLRLEDVDGDGVINPVTEQRTIYDEMSAATDFGSPKAIVVVDGATPIGTQECTSAVANSTGSPGAIAAFGSTSLALNSVVLEATSLPTSSNGFVIVSQSPGFVMSPMGSQGNVCLSGSIGRYVNDIFNSGATGSASTPVDLSAIPGPMGFVPAAVGETWRFQAWYRDANPTPTSNFTDAIAITITN